MRRSKRTTPHVATRIRWMSSASPGGSTPMNRLMSWLERHGEEFRVSKRKVELLEQLGEEMATSGIYGLTMSSIRSQLSRLKKGVRLRAEGGKCTSTDVNHYYERLLLLLFDEEERAEMRERAAECVEEEQEHIDSDGNRKTRRTRSNSSVSHIVAKNEEAVVSAVEDRGIRGANLRLIDPILDTMEIRRRYELLSARQGLQQQGVDRETIVEVVWLYFVETVDFTLEISIVNGKFYNDTLHFRLNHRKF